MVKEGLCCCQKFSIREELSSSEDFFQVAWGKFRTVVGRDVLLEVGVP